MWWGVIASAARIPSTIIPAIGPGPRSTVSGMNSASWLVAVAKTSQSLVLMFVLVPVGLSTLRARMTLNQSARPLLPIVVDGERGRELVPAFLRAPTLTRISVPHQKGRRLRGALEMWGGVQKLPTVGTNLLSVRLGLPACWNAVLRRTR